MRDSGSMLTVEALLAATILVGTGVTLVAIVPRDAAVDAGWTDLRVDAEGALLALHGQEVRDDTRLARGLAEGLHCDRAPSCAGTPELDRLRGYLGPGVSYRLVLSNGLAQRPLVDDGAPPAVAASGSVVAAPAWPHVFAEPVLSCQDPAAAVQVRALAIRGGAAQRVTSMSASGGGVTVAGSALAADVWNVSVPAAAWTTGPVALEVATRDASYRANASVATCLLGASLGKALADGAARSTLATQRAAPGEEATFAWDLAPVLAAAPGATLRAVALDVHEPAPPPSGAARAPAATVAASGANGSARWQVPPASLYGDHPTVLRAELDVPGAVGVVRVEVRVLAATPVTLAGGHVPPEAIYRVSLQAWRGEWG